MLSITYLLIRQPFNLRITQGAQNCSNLTNGLNGDCQNDNRQNDNSQNDNRLKG